MLAGLSIHISEVVPAAAANESVIEQTCIIADGSIAMAVASCHKLNT